MGAMEETRLVLAAKFQVIFPHLDERQRRLLMGAEARALGHGGIRLVARAAGVREATVSLGVDELDSGAEPLGRVRRPGSGRKQAADLDPGLRPALLALVEPEERGDPMSPLRWTTKSTRNLAAELTRQGHRVGADTVGDLLREEGFSLQGNAKTIEGQRHPDRDAQFRYINEQVKAHQGTADPVISVDTKKKELVGQFKNAGRQWRPKGQPEATRTHDFPGDSAGKAVPYGVYDLTADAGWVSVGTDHDTAAFAVESIRRWWTAAGSSDYPLARRLLITADAGGSNGYRTRAWKAELAALAAETGLEITCCHFPPGTSKWNKVEHRLFSHITMNWRGRPLTSHEVIVETIAATTTRTGLTVEAELDTSTYDTGITVTDAQIDALAMSRHRFHGDWNYTLHTDTDTPSMSRSAAASRAATISPPPQAASLRNPELTGMPEAQLGQLIAELTPALEQLRERERRTHRGGPRQRARGAGAKDKLTPADRVLLTVLYLRKLGTRDLFAEFFDINGSTLTRAVHQVQPLLAEHGHTIAPSTARFRTPADVAAFLTTADDPIKIKPAC